MFKLKVKAVNILLSIILVVGTTNYMFWPYFPEGTFHVLQAFTWVLAALALFILCRRLDFYSNLFTNNLVLITGNNLIDELLFNPYELSLNEFVFFVLILVINCYKLYERFQKRPKR